MHRKYEKISKTLTPKGNRSGNNFLIKKIYYKPHSSLVQNIKNYKLNHETNDVAIFNEQKWLRISFFSEGGFFSFFFLKV